MTVDNNSSQDNKEICRDILKPGIILDKRYEIKSLLRTCENEKVYEAFDHRFEKRLCVVKEIVPSAVDLNSHQNMSATFKKEATILSRMRHPDLPLLVDYFAENGRYYLVMDYMEGVTFEKVIKNKDLINEDKVIDWAKDILDALEYLHNQSPSFVYQNLNPRNIILRNSDGKAVISDFAIERTVEKWRGTVQLNSFIPAFAPQELLDGKPEPASDIYSLGAVMHCLLTGILPEKPCDFKPVRDFNQKVSEELDAIIMKALSVSVKDRYVSAGEMRDLLEELKGKTRILSKAEIQVVEAIPEREVSAVTSQTVPERDISESSYRGISSDKIGIWNKIIKSTWLLFGFKIIYRFVLVTLIVSYIIWVITGPAHFKDDFCFGYYHNFFDVFYWMFFTINIYLLVPILCFISVFFYSWYNEVGSKFNSSIITVVSFILKGIQGFIGGTGIGIFLCIVICLLLKDITTDKIIDLFILIMLPACGFIGVITIYYKYKSENFFIKVFSFLLFVGTSLIVSLILLVLIGVLMNEIIGCNIPYKGEILFLLFAVFFLAIVYLQFFPPSGKKFVIPSSGKKFSIPLFYSDKVSFCYSYLHEKSGKIHPLIWFLAGFVLMPVTLYFFSYYIGLCTYSNQTCYLAYLNKSLEVNPTDTNIWIKKGDLYYSNRRYQDAIDSYNRALVSDLFKYKGIYILDGICDYYKYSADLEKVDPLYARIESRKQEASRELVSLQTFYITKPEMVLISGNTFQMGEIVEGEYYSEFSSNPHTVTLTDFYIGKYEVTNKEFSAFLNSQGNQIEGGRPWVIITVAGKENSFGALSGCSAPGTIVIRSGYLTHPVIFVSWYGAVAYCNWLSEKEGLSPCYGPKDNRGNGDIKKNGYRLPTEAEWEYACGGGVNTKYFWGDEDDILYYAPTYYPVGQMKPNSFGLYDMIGNASEWCNDWSGDYPSEPVINPVGPATGSEKIIRNKFRGRMHYDLLSTKFLSGFRLARTP